MFSLLIKFFLFCNFSFLFYCFPKSVPLFYVRFSNTHFALLGQMKTASKNKNASSTVYEDWTINRLLVISFLIRALLIFYAHIHDYIFKVKFTDIDYTIYSDAAQHVYHGRSPYARATYRYSPVLAFMVLPNVFYLDFGLLDFLKI